MARVLPSLSSLLATSHPPSSRLPSEVLVRENEASSALSSYRGDRWLEIKPTSV
ncbi:MAG: hypothetical protein ABWK01_04430 [Infirmifilum sp.]